MLNYYYETILDQPSPVIAINRTALTRKIISWTLAAAEEIELCSIASLNVQPPCPVTSHLQSLEAVQSFGTPAWKQKQLNIR